MSLRESVLLITLDYADALRTMHALQRFETLCRDFTGASNELYNLSEMLLVVGLENLPEPSDDVICDGVAGVLDVVLEVID